MSIHRGVRFDWDPHKNELNQDRHGVRFEEAMTAFFDEDALLIDDPDHSTREERHVLLGLGWSGHLLVVSHAFYHLTGTIRLISARRASRTERNHYGNQRNAQ